MTEITWIPEPTKQLTSQAIDVDQAIVEQLPPGCKVMGAKSHGASFWTRTARIDVQLADGTPKKYFLKVSSGELGMSMLRGEYYGVKTLHEYTPGIPRAIAWGTYVSDPSKHFYLAEFMEMIEDLPDIRKFSAMLAKLHHDSMVDPKAPTKFGYHVMTHEGSMYQDLTWSETWEELYSRRFQSFVDQELVSQGPSEEIERLVLGLKEKVIPRLLRPLNTHGRSLKPVALHGNIWCGNMGTNAATGDPVYFDPSVFWGHNEYDVGSMATPRYKLGRQWMREYHKFFPITEPEDDYEDRNLLYAM
ncbi:hypothetical protein J4E83_002474 [Alternaria metachromatica]|uniref:uncharacterized protein n=1 Tax=Alternaria metachromatica TaxID=283354 RepID=UPI0020C53D34|nr:uncharacterized protein J4E83_002474 [Alternaria metachromatica]KAI4630948.1 hypothetical protein J4E83_002474 [Alternaria metachromatica]